MKQELLPSERDIIAGLGQRKLADRRPWLAPAAGSGSKAVFAVLAKMFPTRNAIHHEVLEAMKELNIRTNGAFTGQLDPVLRAEYEQLISVSPITAARFLLASLWYAVRVPQGMPSFARWARKLAETKSLSVEDSVLDEIATIADVALAAAGDAGALKRASKAWMEGKLMERDELIEICSDLRSQELWEPLQKVLHAKPEADDWLPLAMVYLDYAAALKLEPDANVVARYQKLAAMPFRG